MWRLLTIAFIFLCFMQFNTLAQTQSDCTLIPRLEIGSTARVTPGDPNNVRAEPTTNSANIGSIPGSGMFVVMDGMVCADGFNWWQVNFDGLIGWTVEGNNGTYWVEPFEPDCDYRVWLGQPARAITDIILYESPSTNATQQDTIARDEAFEMGTQVICQGEDIPPFVSATYGDNIGWIESTMWIDAAGYSSQNRVANAEPRPLPVVEDAAERLLSIEAMPPQLADNALSVDNIQQLELEQVFGEGYITNFAWSPDDTEIAVSGTLDARIYQTENFNAEPQIFGGHDFIINQIAYSPDGRFIATGDISGRLIIRDANSLDVIAIFEHDGEITSLIFSPDSRILSLVTKSPEATIVHSYSLDNGITLVYEIEVSSSAIDAGITFTQDSQRLIAISSKIVVWNAEDGEEVQRIETSGNAGYRIETWAISSDEQVIAIIIEEICCHFTAIDYYLRAWNIETGEFDGRYQGSVSSEDRQPIGGTFRLEFDPDGTLLWALVDNQLRWYSTYVEDLPQTEFTMPDVQDFVISPDGDTAAISGLAGEIRLSNLRSEPFYTQTNILYGIVGSVRKMQFNSDGTRIAAIGSDSSLRIWDVESGQRQGSFRFVSAGGMPVPLDNERVYASNRIWSIASGQVIEQLDTQVGSYTNGLAVTPDGRVLGVSRRTGESSVLWDTASGDILYDFETDIGYLDVAFNQDASILAYPGYSVKVIDLNNPAETIRLPGQYGYVDDFAISPDSRLMLIYDGGDYPIDAPEAMVIRDIATGDLLMNVPVELGQVVDIEWHYSGRYIVWAYAEYISDNSSFIDRFVLFSLETQSIDTTWTFDFRPSVMEMSPDGSLVAMGDYDGNIVFFDVATGEALHSVQAHAGEISQIIFSDDGARLFTAGYDSTNRVWSVP